jgi:hypothetical protein
VYVGEGPRGPTLVSTFRHATNKARSNAQILYLERTVPSAFTVTSLVNNGSSRPAARHVVQPVVRPAGNGAAVAIVFCTTPEETLMPQDSSPDETVFAAAEDPDWLPPEINTGVAHSARVYNYLLGRKVRTVQTLAGRPHP